MQIFTGSVVKSYEIRERIGAGGFGAVYRAVHPAVGREVAIKIILPEHANQPEFVKRFETEAQLVARLEHPHIVPLYDYWREPSGAYLVMRYLRGGSLRDSIEEHGAWAPARVAQMLSQIAAALTFAHRNGVVHRDLKSDNILIDEDGNSYLTDFGIAKDLGAGTDLTRDNILGTPAYLSPEQIRGEVASAKSDVYALGILLYEALAGTKPFIDHTPASVLYKQLNEPIPDISKVRPELPQALDVVLQRATAKDVDDRYETTLDFARAFASVIRDVAPGMPASGENSTLYVNPMSITQAEENIFQLTNPYKGLRAFQQADTDDFHGRDELITELLERLRVRASNADFLAIVGPSGSGKSSVVKAGMLPRVQDGVLDKSIDWFVTEMMPGTHPMEELEAALLAIATNEVPGLLEQLREDERGFVRAIKRILPADKSEFVLFIDQFEEVFTLVEDENRREHFLNSILHAAEDQRSRIKIVVTMRADFYDRPLLYTNFGQLIRNNTELVLPLSDKELREAIVAPADRVGMALDEGLVEAIINDVHAQPGALPLLQYALTELFERREGRRMTLAAYRDIGGTIGALARRAEELFQSFNKEQRAATRQMFLRLVTLGEGTEDTRRRVFQSELLSIGNQAVAMRHVIEQFGKFRLLTFDHDPQTRGSTVEVAHEALIRQWERVRSWLDENRESLRLHRRLTTSSDEWEHARRDVSYLARGARLQQFEDLLDNDAIELNQRERQYVEMSVEAREERLNREREQEAREERLRAAARQRLQLLTVMAIITAIVLGVLSVFAVGAQRSAEENEATAVAAQELAIQEANRAATSAAVASNNAAEARSLALAANARNSLAAADPALALALALEAKDVYQPVPSEVLRTLATTTYAPGPRYKWNDHTGSVTATAFSRNTAYALSASVDGTVRVWDIETGDEALSVSVPDVAFFEVAMHPNNDNFAAGASDGNVYVWDFPSGTLRNIMRGHTDEVWSVTYSNNGASIASGSLDTSVRIWGTNSGTEVLTIDDAIIGTVFSVDFSPDGTRIAASSGDQTIFNTSRDVVDRLVRVFDTNSGNQILKINPESGYPRAMSYSPDGTMIAVGLWDSSFEGTARIYDATTGEEIMRFFGHTTPLTDVRFSPDSSLLATSAWDQTVRIYNIARNEEIQTFRNFGNRILSMDYAHNGEYLVLGLGDMGDNEFAQDRAIDTSVWLWDIVNREQADVLKDHDDWVWTVDVSPNNSMIATGGGPLNLRQQQQGEEFVPNDTLARIWDYETGNVLFTFRGHSDTVDSVKFHPNGRWLLTASWDEFIILWDITSQRRIRVYRGHEGRVYMVAFVGDGSRFLSAGDDGIVRLWDTDTGTVLQTYEHTRIRTQDITDDEGTVIGQEDVEVANPIYGVDVSPDVTRLVTASGGSNVAMIWDLESGEKLQELVGHNSWLQEARFHPTLNQIVTTSWDNTVRLWDVETGTELRQFMGHNGHTFGVAFSSDGALMFTTSQDTSVRMWDFATGEELHRFDQHTNWVQEVVITSDDEFIVSGAQDRTARIWRVDTTAEEYADYAQDIRYIRELTCDERDIYRVATCADTD